ncbi:type III-B CRISPR-associated protein Cas10/Cmr2 [Myxococcota bacterium]
MSLIEGGAKLVFPALEKGDQELVSCPSPLRPDTGLPPLNIANKVLAELPSAVQPPVLARAVRDDVRAFWRGEIAGEVREEHRGLLSHGIDAAWDEQVETFLEFSAAWAPLRNYPDARKTVEQAVAARKNLRDFAPWQKLRAGVAKSSLDGARETVLRREGRDEIQVRKYRIAKGEELDAVGLIKRTGGEPDPFVPIVNIALASWLDLAQNKAHSELAHLREACRDIKLARVARHDLPCARPLSFDASVLLPSRWRPLFEEQGLGDAQKAEAWGQDHVRPLLRVLGDPYPYVACLVADGDHMGRVIDSMESADEHRQFSRQLARFAGDARRIVEQEHRGSLVYAGGDDVLAFLPLPEVLACAQALRCRFAEVMTLACGARRSEERPTLSVGVGVGHVLEGMGDLLALGRAAEQAAKGAKLRSENRDRNALAVVVDKRSGGRRSWRARWEDWSGDPVGRLRADSLALEQHLSTRKVYEVARTLARLPLPDCAREPGWDRVIALEVERSLVRAHLAEGGGVKPADVGLVLDRQAGYAALYQEVSSWVERMLVARAFAAAAPTLGRTAEEVAA